MGKKKIAAKPTSGTSKSGVAKKVKQPTQRARQERIMVMGPSGKVRFEWRPW